MELQPIEKPTLEKGELICKKCEGDGVWCNKFDKKFINDDSDCNSGESELCEDVCLCMECKGSGKLDWVENVTGKQ